MASVFGSAPFFFSSRRRHTRCLSDWSSDVCSSDLPRPPRRPRRRARPHARRPDRPGPRGGRRRGRALDGGAVPQRRAGDVPHAGSALPPALVTAASAVIFDMDGVLIDSGAHHRDAWRLLLGELGLVPAVDFWRRTIGRPAEEAVPLLLDRPVPAAEAAALARRKREHYTRLAARG